MSEEDIDSELHLIPSTANTAANPDVSNVRKSRSWPWRFYIVGLMLFFCGALGGYLLSIFPQELIAGAKDKCQSGLGVVTVPVESSVSPVFSDDLDVHSQAATFRDWQECPASHQSFYTCTGFCVGIQRRLKDHDAFPLNFSSSGPPLTADKGGQCHFLPMTEAMQRLSFPDNKNWAPPLVPPLLAAGGPMGLMCAPPADRCPNWNVWDKIEETDPNEKPPQRPSESLMSNFTLSGALRDPLLQFSYRNDKTTSTPRTYSKSELDEFRQQLRQQIANLRTVVSGNNALMVSYGPYTKTPLPAALVKYQFAFEKARVVVLGTLVPWVEAALVELGAAEVVVAEYTQLYFQGYEQIAAVQPHLMAKQIRSGAMAPFDAAVTFSSIEHDGLGRYGDPVNPDGDLQTMLKTACMLRPGGFLFYAAPLNTADHLVFNLHRIYGPLRLPFMLRYFHAVDIFGPPSDHLGDFDQPMLVLQNKMGCHPKLTQTLPISP